MDVDMYHEESDTPAMARTSNLNEELGMVTEIKFILNVLLILSVSLMLNNLLTFRLSTFFLIKLEPLLEM